MTNQLFLEVIDGRIPLPARPKPPAQPKISDALDLVIDAIGDVFNAYAKAFKPIIESLQDLGVIESPPPADLRERALWAKQRQGTGPAHTPLRVRGRNTHYKEKH